VGLERGPLSLVSTIEDILGRNSSGSGLEHREYGLGDPLRWPSGTLYPQKLALTSPTSGGRSVDIVRLLTKATEFSLVDRSSRWKQDCINLCFWVYQLNNWKLKPGYSSFVLLILRVQKFIESCQPRFIMTDIFCVKYSSSSSNMRNRLTKKKTVRNWFIFRSGVGSDPY
jgi:hypothetical protein